MCDGKGENQSKVDDFATGSTDLVAVTRGHLPSVIISDYCLSTLSHFGQQPAPKHWIQAHSLHGCAQSRLVEARKRSWL
jgi:hypothetical protein